MPVSKVFRKRHGQRDDFHEKKKRHDAGFHCRLVFYKSKLPDPHAQGTQDMYIMKEVFEPECPWPTPSMRSLRPRQLY